MKRLKLYLLLYQSFTGSQLVQVDLVHKFERSEVYYRRLIINSPGISLENMSILKSSLSDVKINEKLSFPDFVFSGIENHENKIALVSTSDI